MPILGPFSLPTSPHPHLVETYSQNAFVQKITGRPSMAARPETVKDKSLAICVSSTAARLRSNCPQLFFLPWRILSRSIISRNAEPSGLGRGDAKGRIRVVVHRDTEPRARCAGTLAETATKVIRRRERVLLLIAQAAGFVHLYHRGYLRRVQKTRSRKDR